MKIILVVSGKNGKNLLFVLDNLQALTLEYAIRKVEKGEILGVHIVKTRKGAYLRANPNSTTGDNLDFISAIIRTLTTPKRLRNNPALKQYQGKRANFLEDSENQGRKVIYIDGKLKRTESEIIKYLSAYKNDLFPIARKLKVDPYLLGAILIDEELRRDWVDDWSDWLAKLGLDRSVGIAQVKVSTARDLIRRGFYPPDPSDAKISQKNIGKVSGRYLFEYLNNPKTSICFAAAKINQIKHDFSLRYDIKNLEIIADLYSRGSLSSTGGKPSKRGKQIVREFYKIAQKVL